MYLSKNAKNLLSIVVESKEGLRKTNLDLDLDLDAGGLRGSGLRRLACHLTTISVQDPRSPRSSIITGAFHFDFDPKL